MVHWVLLSSYQGISVSRNAGLVVVEATFFYSLVVGHDQTDILREGYWASYNCPFYEEVCTFMILGINFA